MFSRKYWSAALERAISAGAIGFLLAWGGGTLPDVSIPMWSAPLAFAGGFVLSIMKGLGASQIGNNGPSFSSAEKLAD